MAGITFRLVEIISIQILSSLFGLSDELCSRKFGQVVLEIALVKTYFAKIPIQNILWEWARTEKYIAKRGTEYRAIVTRFTR